jgi:hypothetical protein
MHVVIFDEFVEFFIEHCCYPLPSNFNGDAPSNMQWQTFEEAKAKDRVMAD